MEEAFEHSRCTDGAEGASLDFAHAGGGSTGCGFPEAYAFVAGRLPLRLAANHSTPVAPKALHRCLQRHGISRLPDTRDKPKRKAFKRYPIGYFHIDIAEVNTEEGRLYLLVGTRAEPQSLPTPSCTNARSDPQR